MLAFIFSIGDLLGMRSALKKLLSIDKLPIEIALDLQMAMPRLQEVYAAYDTQYASLMRRLGTPSAADPQLLEVTASSPNAAEFHQNYHKLISVPVNIHLPTVTTAVLLSLGTGLSANDINSLRAIVPDLPINKTPWTLEEANNTISPADAPHIAEEKK